MKPVLPVQAEDLLFRRIARRIVPLLFTCYLVAFLDRVNVGIAQLQMSQSLGLSAAQYGLAAGLFFLPYALLEIPSNLWFERIGARLTLLRIMVLWGLTASATMFVRGPAQFFALRMLLGAFEAGFFPGVILYLSYWFPSRYRARTTSAFWVGSVAAGAVSGPLFGSIMTGLDGVAGLQGWQWVFLLAGAPACMLGVICYFWLDDRPQDARWLSAQDKAMLEEAHRADHLALHATDAARGEAAARPFAVIRDPMIYALTLIYFAGSCGGFTMNFWLPAMIRDTGVTSTTTIGWLAAIPAVAGIVGALVLSYSSDLRLERRYHLAGCLAAGALGLVGTLLWKGGPTALLVAFSFASVGIFGSMALFWSLPSSYLPRSQAALGIAVINTLGISAGFFCPSILGFVKTMTGSVSPAIALFAFLLAVGCYLTIFVVPERAMAMSRREISEDANLGLPANGSSPAERA
ncbi:MFS transporter [Paraburkholderia sp.]|uniref:MFS transporter n=1 Tax=Paraburkholderia sp. TaxID=1926495 RepID=UPI0039E5E5A8